REVRVAAHRRRPAILRADTALVVAINERDDLGIAGLDRHHSLRDGRYGIRLVAPARIDARHFAHPFIGGGGPGDKAMALVAADVRVLQRVTECLEAIAQGIVWPLAGAAALPVADVVGLADADDSSGALVARVWVATAEGQG